MKYPRKNNLTNRCGTCNQPCSRGAIQCELCARPNRMPQRRNLGITVTSSNVERVMKRAQDHLKKIKY